MTQLQTANEWLMKNQRKLVSCPYQPGQLTISKNACSKRYVLGKNENPADLLKGDLFHYTFKRGLSLCRECPIGRKLAVAHETQEPQIPLNRIFQEQSRRNHGAGTRAKG
jgi:hypothetical protein